MKKACLCAQKHSHLDLSWEHPNQNPVQCNHSRRAAIGRLAMSETGSSGLALRPVVETINSDVRVPTLPHKLRDEAQVLLLRTIRSCLRPNKVVS
jgi:hypothetical protein